MSQYPPNPPDNQGYAPAFYNEPLNLRPASVTGLAITGIVLGAAGIFCRGCGAISGGIMLGNGGKNIFAPNMPAITDHSFYIVSFAGAFIDLFFWIALLIGGIAALKLKPAARSGLVLWSVLMLCWQMIWFVLELAILLPATLKLTAQMQAQQKMATVPGFSMNGFMKGAAVGGYVVNLALFSVLPILILWLWTRPHVKAAFNAPFAGTTSPNPPNGM